MIQCLSIPTWIKCGDTAPMCISSPGIKMVVCQRCYQLFSLNTLVSAFWSPYRSNPCMSTCSQTCVMYAYEVMFNVKCLSMLTPPLLLHHPSHPPSLPAAGSVEELWGLVQFSGRHPVYLAWHSSAAPRTGEPTTLPSLILSHVGPITSSDMWNMCVCECVRARFHATLGSPQRLTKGCFMLLNSREINLSIIKLE